MLWTELPPAARPEVAQRPWMSKEEAAAAIRQARRWSGGKEYVPLGQGGNRLSFKGTGGFDTNEAQLRVSCANRVAGPFYWKLLTGYDSPGGRHDLDAAERSFIEKFRATLIAQTTKADRAEYWELLAAVEYVACKSHAKKVGKWDPKGLLRDHLSDSATSAEEDEDGW